MSRPVYILNNNKKVKRITPNEVTIMFGNDYHFSNEGYYHGPEYSSANFGDILFFEFATEHLYIDSTYDVTKYPIADYEPIAVCIFDAASHKDGLSVWMSVKWCDVSHAGQGSINGADASWGKSGSIINSSTTENSIIQNNRIKELDTSNWQNKTSWKVSDYKNYYPAFEMSWRYKTPGTNEGDWYLPSYYDVTKGHANKTNLSNIYTNIKNVSNSVYLNRVANWCYLSTDTQNDLAGAWSQFNDIHTAYPSKRGQVFVRPVLIK